MIRASHHCLQGSSFIRCVCVENKGIRLREKENVFFAKERTPTQRRAIKSEGRIIEESTLQDLLVDCK